MKLVLTLHSSTAGMFKLPIFLLLGRFLVNGLEQQLLIKALSGGREAVVFLFYQVNGSNGSFILDADSRDIPSHAQSQGKLRDDAQAEVPRHQSSQSAKLGDFQACIHNPRDAKKSLYMLPNTSGANGVDERLFFEISQSNRFLASEGVTAVANQEHGLIEQYF